MHVRIIAIAAMLVIAAVCNQLSIPAKSHKDVVQQTLAEPAKPRIKTVEEQAVACAGFKDYKDYVGENLALAFLTHPDTEGESVGFARDAGQGFQVSVYVNGNNPCVSNPVTIPMVLENTYHPGATFLDLDHMQGSALNMYALVELPPSINAAIRTFIVVKKTVKARIVKPKGPPPNVT